MPTFYELAQKHLKNQKSANLKNMDGNVKVMISIEDERPGRPDQPRPRLASIEIRRYTATGRKEWISMVIHARSDGKYRTQYYIRTVSMVPGDVEDFRAEPMSNNDKDIAWAKELLGGPTYQLRCTYRGEGTQIFRISSQPGDFGWNSDN